MELQLELTNNSICGIELTVSGADSDYKREIKIFSKLFL